MRIGVLGTGIVGRTLASALLRGGHEVRMGSRTAGNEAAVAWAREIGGPATEGTFADAAGFGELIINATAGGASLEALNAAGAEQLAGKVLLDVSNPLDFSKGMPPTLTVCNDDSLAEQIQREFSDVRVVKTLNTVTAAVMVEPALVPGGHTIFVAGNDAGAKAQAAELLGEFGWPEEAILDLGDITAARGLEMYLPLWLRLWGATGSPMLNVAVRSGGDAAAGAEAAS
ncbi:MAG: 8-hydroxy-5-deazaflavin:NADPH oxidoreductase [Solirubrobacteraceae bacterium]|jgi:predicted dinucleotide-binding enzyme|nr:8-hydroxy-5-deazaflavin:NADPH oxidoreductase [Solirubrobacteraceae bacterium]